MNKQTQMVYDNISDWLFYGTEIPKKPITEEYVNEIIDQMIDDDAEEYYNSPCFVLISTDSIRATLEIAKMVLLLEEERQNILSNSD